MSGRVLVVDDDRDMCRLLAFGLGKRGFDVTWRTSADQALELVEGGDLDVVVTDLDMAGMDGLQLCERVVANRPDVPVALLTAFGSFDAAVAALRVGAYDFITKPPDLDALARTVERGIRKRLVAEEVKRLPECANPGAASLGLLGTSPSMRRVEESLERIAASDASVLITGETGTGKELAARALHHLGRRSAGPFVAINCAAVPEALLESELFGHVRGAFTDACANRTGLFLQATGGTLFLDEIAELPLGLQPKLLRVLQERVVRPVGSSTEVRCDVRLVAATNRDLEATVREGGFREDLYFRVNVIRVDLPPLRARGEDVLLLAQHFVERYGAETNKVVRALSPAAAERLLAYAWPGNVRELQNCIERAVAFARYDRIAVEDLPERIRSYRLPGTVITGDRGVDPAPLEEVERHHILRTLEKAGGNKTRAARMLGVDRKTLFRKLTRYHGD